MRYNSMKSFRGVVCPILAVLLASTAACKPVDTGEPKGPTPIPTPETPGQPYNNETYAAALRSASLKLRGQLAGPSEIADVLENGRPAYEQYIDEYVASPEFVPTMQAFFKHVFGMGDAKVAVFHPDTFQQIQLNTNEPSNLAAFLINNNRPWTEIITADYCVGDNLLETPCTGDLPPEMRAGFITNQSYARLYGRPNTFNLQRTSVTHQITSCGIYPDGDTPLVRTNADPGTLPADNPATPPRLHAKYQGSLTAEDGSEIFCAACHSALISKRALFAKFDVDGFYRPNRTIYDVEAPVNNAGKCYVVPPGRTQDDLKDCDDPTFDINIDGCCFDPLFTDVNSSDASRCNEPGEPCIGVYHSTEFASPRELADLLLDRDVSWDIFYDCQTTRFYNYALGISNGVLGLQAGGGAAPDFVDSKTLVKYRSLFEHEQWNVRELLRAIFKGDEYLNTQVM